MKLWNKIIGVFLGLSMAVGTGLAISSNAKSSIPVHAAEATATFEPSHFEGQGTTSTGSAMSATVNGVTLSTNKGFGTTQVRIYKGGSLTIASTNTITGVAFTFSGSYNGGLQASYTGLSTTSWEQASLGSQLRFTQCVVTFEAGGHTHSWDDGVITTAPTCTEDGVKTYTCTDCGGTKTESIPATGHSYVNGICEHCGAEQPTYFSILPSDGEPAMQADYTINKLPFAVSVTESTLADEIRVYKGKSITISGVLFKKIVFTCTANGTTKYGPGSFGEGAPEGYTFEAEGKTGTWEGSADSISFTATDNQVRITEIDIYIKAEGFAQVFMDSIICNSAGTSAPTYLEGYSWSVLSNIYDTLDLTEKGLLKNADALEGGSIIEQAMARYEYIVGKYGYDNFIQRSVSPLASPRILFGNLIDNTTAIPLIVIVSIIAISSIGVLVFLKKKKVN